jgi:hypothetical protein
VPNSDTGPNYIYNVYQYHIRFDIKNLHGILLKRAFHGTKNFLPTLRWIYLSHHYVDTEKLVQQYYITEQKL